MVGYNRPRPPRRDPLLWLDDPDVRRPKEVTVRSGPRADLRYHLNQDGSFKDLADYKRGDIVEETTGPDGTIIRYRHDMAPEIIPPRRFTQMAAANRLPDLVKLRETLIKGMTQLAEAEALAARFPAQPPPGSVLRFERKFQRDGQTYFYVAYRAPNGGWYMTGNDQNSSPTWEELITVIGNEPCEFAMDWQDVPVKEAEAVDTMTDPAKWYELVFGQKPAEASADEPAGKGTVIDAEKPEK